MPFEPLSPEEEMVFPKPCAHPEHNPPSHIVLPKESMKWVCPGCGHSLIIRETMVRWELGNDDWNWQIY